MKTSPNKKTEEERDREFQHSLDDITAESLAKVLHEGMNTTVTVWSKNAEGVAVAEKIPDHKTRLSCATKLMEYKHGLPI